MDATVRSHGIRFLIAASLLGLLLATQTVLARSWDWRKDTGLHLTYTGGYDGNILELSDDDTDRFLDNDLPGPTSPSTYDDLVQEFGVKFKIYSPSYFGYRRTKLFYTLGYKTYSGNSFNDRASHSLFLLQDITREVDLVASYFLIPQRYLRDYYDRDLGTILPCEFAYHLYTAGLRGDVTDNIRVGARYEGYQVYYNRYFTEYDSESHGFRADMQIKLPRNFVFNAEVRYRNADNVGFKQSDAVIVVNPDMDAEYGDGSYGEEWLVYSLAWESPTWLDREWDITVTHRLRHRYYTSELPLNKDPFHAGREHLQQRLFFDIQTEILPGITGGPSIEYEWRNTDAPVDRVAEVKDFSAFRAMLGLRFEIWD